MPIHEESESPSLFQRTVHSEQSHSQTVLLISDRENIHHLKTSLQYRNCNVQYELIDSFASQHVRNDIINQIKQNPPDVLWFHVPNWELKLRVEDQRRVAICFATMMHLQLEQSSKHLLIEGNLHHFQNWYPDRLRKALNHPRLSSHNVWWCSLGVKLAEKPICRYSKIIGTLQSLPLNLVACCQTDKKASFRRFKASRSVLHEFQHLLHDALVPLLWPRAKHERNTNPSYPSISNSSGSSKSLRPSLPKKISSTQEYRDPDEPGEHADDKYTKEELKPRFVKKKASDVENVFDDCGDDVSAIQLAEEFYVFDDAEQSTQFGDPSETETDADVSDFFDSAFMTWALTGSDPGSEDLSERPHSVHLPDIQSVLTALEQKPGQHDVCEIYGGQGAIIKLSIRRKLITGPNWDVTCGVNLLDSDSVKKLWEYLVKHAPLVVVGGPPCTAFSAWQQINKHVNPDRYYEALRVGTRLANLMSDIVAFQLRNHRHFLVENPLTSKLWQLGPWQKILSTSDIVTTVLDQCMVGLCDPEGYPTLKPTLLVASHPVLLRNLNLRCPRKHQHVQLAGSVLGILRTRFAQAWPRRMVEIIVCNICELLRLIRKSQGKHAFPAVVSCPGCRSHAVKHDPRHDRGPDCKFPNDQPVRWECAACKLFRPSTHASHSFEKGMCQWAEALVRQSTARSGHPRDPRTQVRAAPAEAAETTQATPVPVLNFTWETVRSLELTTTLDSIRIRDGWHTLSDGIALTTTNCRTLRTCEPRYQAQKFRYRSTYCFFPECVHPHGNWWRLEYLADFTAPAYDTLLQLPMTVPIIIHIFTMSSAPTEKKGESAPSSNSRLGAQDNPLRSLMRKWDEEEEPTHNDEGPEPEIPVLSEPEQPLGEDLPIPEPDWTSWDLGRMLRGLRSDNVAVRIAMLRRLHQRWYHATSQRMTALLQAAGVDKAILQLISSVVDTCKACRQWKRPQNRATHSSSLASRFNETLQMDLLFLEEGVLCHLIDVLTRFGMAGLIPDRTPSTLIDFIMTHWVAHYGPPKTLLTDQEGGATSDEFAVWAERHDIQTRLIPRGAHANVIERHHQILREMILRVKSSCTSEKLIIPIKWIILECVFVKNCLTNIGGQSPFQAVLGIKPQMLYDIEAAGQSALTDNDGGILGASRHSVRLREIALEGILSATARVRLQRAEQQKTRTDVRSQDYQIGDAVDLYRSPATKSLSGWRGPCTVVSLHDLSHGRIDVKWQGRIMAARPQDVRPHIFLVGLTAQADPPTHILRDYILSLSSPSVQTFALVETPRGWQFSKVAQEKPSILSAIRYVAHTHFGMEHCIGGRLGRGSTTLSGIINASVVVLCWWPAASPELYRSMELQPDASTDLRSIFSPEEDTCWVQMIAADFESLRDLRRIYPDDPYLQHPPPRPPPMDPAVPMQEDRRSDPPPTPMSTRHSHRSSPMSSGRPPSMPSDHQREMSDADTVVAPVPSASSHSRSRTPFPSSQSTVRYPDVSFDQKRALPSDSSSSHRPHSMARHDPGSSSSSGQATAPQPPVLPFRDEEAANIPIPEDDESLTSTVEYEPEELHTVFHVFDKITNSICPPELHADVLYQLNDYRPFTSYRASECQFFIQPDRHLEQGEVCVYDVVEQTTVIVRNLDELTAQEARENRQLCDEAIMKELQSFVTHDCWEVVKKTQATNMLTARMVLRWKVVAGERIVKARLCAHGFKDDVGDGLSSYASTSSRWGQRLICSVASSRRWKLKSLDISSAFLQGVTFQELSELTGEPLREVSLTPPVNLEHLFRKLKGLSTVDFKSHCLKLLKPIYGLRDAPRAWRKRLHVLLTEIGFRALAGDDSLYVLHNALCELICLLSTHVDDLKVAGEDKTVDNLILQLEKKVGKLKLAEAYNSSFEHCGLVHSQSIDYSITLSQTHYASKLRPIDTIQLDLARPELLLIPSFIALFQSLLGGLSWLTLTRADIAIYVQALQRANKAPRIEHLVRLNKVCKWVQKKVVVLFYSSKLDTTKPCKILGVGDSAFRKESEKGLAIRGAFAGICQQHENHPGGVFHVLEFFSRRQKRVTRSTFASELLSSSDVLDICKLLGFAVLEISKPTSLKELALYESEGHLPIPIEVCVDARSVFDSLVSEQTRCSEGGLLMTLLAMKEALRNRLLSRLWWVDTRDMTADGLTKGTVGRSAIIQLCCSGEWVLQHPCLPFVQPLAGPTK